MSKLSCSLILVFVFLVQLLSCLLLWKSPVEGGVGDLFLGAVNSIRRCPAGFYKLVFVLWLYHGELLLLDYFSSKGECGRSGFRIAFCLFSLMLAAALSIKLIFMAMLGGGLSS